MIQAWAIWILCNLENKIISVERILQYTTIPSEPPLVSEEENRPDPSWPAYGEIDIRNLQVGGIFSPCCFLLNMVLVSFSLIFWPIDF